MPLYDPAIFDGASFIFDTFDSTETVLGRNIKKREKLKPYNSMWVSYLWVPGIWEKTELRRVINHREKQK